MTARTFTRQLVFRNYHHGTSVAKHVQAVDGRPINNPQARSDYLTGQEFILPLASWAGSIIVAMVEEPGDPVMVTAPIDVEGKKDVLVDVFNTAWTQLGPDVDLDCPIMWVIPPRLLVPIGKRMIRV